MNIDRILETMNRLGVQYLLIGGLNFLLRHAPVMTYDVDFWIENSAENRSRCEAALAELDAEWGADDGDWKPISLRSGGWLDRQSVFCLTSPFGAIDIFRSVAGLGEWRESLADSVSGVTSQGVAFLGISDADMLRCQYALDSQYRKLDRIAALEKALKQAGEES